MYFSEYDGIYFVEGRPIGANIICNISIELDGCFNNAQLKTLDDVKRAMALQVKHNGGNAVVDFIYGQKSAGFWHSFFSLDHVYWTGKGKIARINPANLQ